jgi:hypothetical protein
MHKDLFERDRLGQVISSTNDSFNLIVEKINRAYAIVSELSIK